MDKKQTEFLWSGNISTKWNAQLLPTTDEIVKYKILT